MARSPLNPDRRKVGKRSKDSEKGGKDLPINPRFDRDKVESFTASCPSCGLLGAYFNQGDATRAEQEHQQRAHSNSPHKKTTTADTQGKRNKHGGK